jgi:hypothetical protein
MTGSEDNQVKILFKFYNDLLEQDMVETMWADIVDVSMGHYKIDSLPFYTTLIATDDIVYAEYDDTEEMLLYQETVEASGNSTLWVVITNDATDIDDVMETFYELDCISEAISDRYFAMEVKAETNYLRIRDKLNELKSQKIIDYFEPCLSVNHQY